MKLFLTMLCVATVGALPAEARPLRVAYSYWYPCVPLAIAQEQGYWKSQGLEVELTAFVTSQEVLAAVEGGKVDIAYDMIGTWVAEIATGKTLVVLGETDWSHGSDKLVVAKGSTFDSVKGGALAVYMRSPSVVYFLRSVCKDRKAALADFQLVEKSDDAEMLDAVRTGAVKAAITYDPIASQLLQGGATLVATTADYPGVMPEGFAMRADSLQELGDGAVETFFQGWFSAVDYAGDAAHLAQLTSLMSAVTYAGTETFTADDVLSGLATTPLHSREKALARHAPGAGLWAWSRPFSAFLHSAFDAPVDFRAESSFHFDPLLKAAAAKRAVSPGP